MCAKSWYWLGKKGQDGAVDQAQQRCERQFNQPLLLGQQCAFHIAALKNRQGHIEGLINWLGSNRFRILSVYITWQGVLAMKMLLITEIQNIETSTQLPSVV